MEPCWYACAGMGLARGGRGRNRMCLLFLFLPAKNWPEEDCKVVGCQLERQLHVHKSTACNVVLAYWLQVVPFSLGSRENIQSLE